MEWTHRELCENLQMYLNRLQRRRAIRPGAMVEFPIAYSSRYGSGQVDVYDIGDCYPPHIRAFEVKVSRSDLLADLRSEKWRKYLPACHNFYFAYPAGLAMLEDIPREAGVIIRGEREWCIVRGGPRRTGWLEPRVYAMFALHPPSWVITDAAEQAIAASDASRGVQAVTRIETTW